MLHLLVLNSTHAAISLSPSIFSYDDLDALRSMDHEEFQECVNATNMKAGHAATLRLALALKEEYTSLEASTNSSEVQSFLESCKLGEYCELFIRQG